MVIWPNFSASSRKNLVLNFFFAGLLSVLFILMLPGASQANTIDVGSEPVKRGSVTAGYEDIVMQSVTLATRSGSAQLFAIKINEFGTSAASSTISAVKLYKESNGMGGLQFGSDTHLSKSPATFNSEETRFTLTDAEIITTDPVTFYIVYSISPTAIISRTIGSNIVTESYITVSFSDDVAPFLNLKSREINLVSTPHAMDTNPSPFFSTTNLCQTCHSVHLAPDFSPDFGVTGKDILIQPYFDDPSVVNDKSSDIYNAMCYTCHDGTGASTNIKSQYNSLSATNPGHETTSTGSAIIGYKAPPSGQQYNPRIKIPCMVCHDIHASRTGNYAMIADDLYDYSISNGWVDPNHNGKIDAGDETCWVCHKYSDETTRTVQIMGIDMGNVPESHRSPPKDSSCLAFNCHSSPHALD